jgi:hypothetical protein
VRSAFSFTFSRCLGRRALLHREHGIPGQHDAAALERIGEATAHAARALERELRSA